MRGMPFGTFEHNQVWLKILLNSQARSKRISERGKRDENQTGHHSACKNDLVSTPCRDRDPANHNRWDERQ
jgi:hypothetical protein